MVIEIVGFIIEFEFYTMDHTFSTDSSIRSYMLTQSNLSYSTTGQQSSSSSSPPFNSNNYSHHMHQQVTTHPVPIPQKSAHANTFVHKLYK